MGHIHHLLTLDWGDVLAEAATWTAVAYAVRTLPQPENVWGRWAVNLIQMAFANHDRVSRAAPPTSAAAGSIDE